MELEISKSAALEKLSRLKSSIANVRKETEARVEGIIGTAEVVGGALAISWVNGRYGANGAPAQIMGFDADLVVGGVLFVAGMLDVAGKQSDHLTNLGAGALAAYAAREGFNLGAEARNKALNPASAQAQMNAAQAQASTAGFHPQAVRSAA